MLTSVIDAKENRDIAIIDIPNTFIQTEMEGEKVIMKLRGELAELLVTTSPQLYRKYVIDENGKSVLYVELLKALYGTLKASLLFYKKLSSKLKEKGFQLNPYDACVANKEVNGKQFTIAWHVDDLKLSHEDEDQVTNMIEWFKKEFEDKDIGLVKISRGKKHKFLGMEFDFTDIGAVKIDMKSYVLDMIKSFPEKVTTKAATPAAVHLFQMREDATKLSEEKASIYHTITAKGLFLCKRARADIQTTIAFLSTRVKEPDEDDWKKLKQLIQYLFGTIDLKLTLMSDKLNIIKWFVDASHHVHPDFRSHTGSTMTIGKGSPYSTSIKQKLNTKSSTESELVAVDDLMPMIIWTNNFLKHQGFKTHDTIIYQANKSAILLETNGRYSSSIRTRHIEARYFLSQTTRTKALSKLITVQQMT